MPSTSDVLIVCSFRSNDGQSMSHFVGTPAHSRVWALANPSDVNQVAKAKHLRKRLLSGPTVEIYVGPDRKHWSLHKNLLCHHSSYFESEFRGHEVPKREDTPQHSKLELPDDDPRGFELLVKWLYQGHLDGDDAEMTDEERYDYAVACHKLYQLCDKFDILLLKNLAMDAYRANLNLAQLVPDAEEINEIYRSSAPDSAFRKLMARIAARQIMDPGTDKDAEAYRVCFDANADFAIEMVNAIRHMSGGGMLFEDPTAGQNCNEWHDHQDGSDCYLQRESKQYISVKGASSLDTASCLQRQVLMSLSGTPNHNVPNSAARRLQPPLVELSTEKPTPRRPDATRSAARSKVTPAKPAQRPALLSANNTTTPRRAVTDSAALRMRDRLKNLNINGVQRKDNPGSTASVRSASSAQSTSAAKAPTPKRTTAPVAIASTPSSIAGSGMGRASSVGSTRPRKLSHVNGVVRQFDATNTSLASSDIGSRSEISNRRQPPKLKRKSPG